MLRRPAWRASLKIWLPYIRAGTGADVYTHSLAAALEQLGQRVVTTPFQHEWQYFPWRLRLEKIPDGTDVIVANSWNAFAFAGRGVPVIAVEHHTLVGSGRTAYTNLPQAIFHAVFVKAFLRRSAATAARVVAVSQHTATSWRRSIGGAEPIVIYNGVDTQYFSPAPSHHRNPERDRFRLLFVGKPCARKGADLLPAILSRLGSGFELRCVGGHPLPASLQGHPRVRHLGRLTLEDLRAEYRHAQLLLAPSRLEGFGLAAAEAMSCGTPVVASHAHAFRELIGRDGAGVLCAMDSADDFGRQIKCLAADPERLSQLSRTSRARVVQHFSRRRMASEYLELFRRIVPAPTSAETRAALPEGDGS